MWNPIFAFLTGSMVLLRVIILFLLDITFIVISFIHINYCFCLYVCTDEVEENVNFQNVELNEGSSVVVASNVTTMGAEEQ